MGDAHPFLPGSTGVGGGGGLHFRIPVDVFTGANLGACRTARNTFFGAAGNAAALRQFQGDQSLAILLRPTGADEVIETYLPGNVGNAYAANQWVVRTDAVQGPPGRPGAEGPPGPVQTAEQIATALDSFLGSRDWRSQISGSDLVAAIDAATGSNEWRTARTVLRTAQQVVALIDSAIGTAWRTGGGEGQGGITLEQATDAAGELLATLEQFGYDKATNTLTFGLGANTVTDAQARADSDAHKMDWRTRIGAASEVDLALAVGRIAALEAGGPGPSAGRLLATPVSIGGALNTTDANWAAYAITEDIEASEWYRFKLRVPAAQDSRGWSEIWRGGDLLEQDVNVGGIFSTNENDQIGLLVPRFEDNGAMVLNVGRTSDTRSILVRVGLASMDVVSLERITGMPAQAEHIRAGWSADAAVVESELGTTSDTDSVVLPAASGFQYLGLWRSDADGGDPTEIHISGGGNARNTFGSASDLAVGGVPGKLVVSVTRQNATLLSGETVRLV